MAESGSCPPRPSPPLPGRWEMVRIIPQGRPTLPPRHRWSGVLTPSGRASSSSGVPILSPERSNGKDRPLRTQFRAPTPCDPDRLQKCTRDEASREATVLGDAGSGESRCDGEVAAGAARPCAKWHPRIHPYHSDDSASAGGRPCPFPKIWRRQMGSPCPARTHLLPPPD